MSSEELGWILSAGDRSMRLRCACDPGAPVDLLFELAMEFPDQVAANPALALALASQPDCISSATDVALACIASSPALPAVVGDVLESLIRDRAVASDVSPAASAAEFMRIWRSRGARQVLVDVSAPCGAAEGLHPGFERATRGRVILAARLGLDSFRSGGNEKNGEGSAFEAGSEARGSGRMWPRVLLPAPPDGDYAFSRRCDWDRLRGEAVVELADYPGNASAVIFAPVDDAVTATVFFDHLKLNDSWSHAMTSDGLGALRRAADSLRRCSDGLSEGELAIACCAYSDGTYQELRVGTMERAYLEAYLTEGEDVFVDGHPDDPEDVEPGDEDLREAAPESGLIELLGRVDPTELGWALDGGKSCGGYDEFAEGVQPSASAQGPEGPWQPLAVDALYKSLFPAGRLEWSGGALHQAGGSTDDVPAFFIALADAAGTVAIVMMHFQYADGWRRWRVATDPLVEVAAAP